MELYFVNRKSDKPDQQHLVHKDGCDLIPAKDNRIKLGFFSHCSEALAEAKTYFPRNVSYCTSCCPKCQSD